MAWALGFVPKHIFPASVASYFNESNFEAVRKARSRLRVAHTSPSPLQGLKLDFMNLHDCTSAAQAQNLISAAAAARACGKWQAAPRLTAALWTAQSSDKLRSLIRPDNTQRKNRAR